MALSVSGLKAAVIAAMPVAEDTDKMATFAEAIATAIVDYFKANAVITCAIPSGSINTTGSASAQSGPPSNVNISGTIS